MKENKKNLYSRGFEMLRTSPLSVSVMREYWKGSPWRALREMLRG